MKFTENEIVVFHFNLHSTRRIPGGNKHMREPRTTEARFLRMRTPESAVLEFITPLGKEQRAVPVKNVSKKVG